MKTIMSSCPVLALPDFSQPFIVQCDASGEGIGAVLMQKHHPIAFESQKLKDYECHYSIYDKEMLAILQKWVSKVQAYDFEIEYVKGKNNVVADALSRRSTSLSLMSISIDWRSLLFIDYSKNKFDCGLMDGRFMMIGT